MELSVTTINNFAKNSIVDVAGVSGYDGSYDQPLHTMHMWSPWWQKTVNVEIIIIIIIIIIDLYEKDGSGHW